MQLKVCRDYGYVTAFSRVLFIPPPLAENPVHDRSRYAVAIEKRVLLTSVGYHACQPRKRSETFSV